MKFGERIYLEQASNALFQDREAYRAVGKAWPEELDDAHEAIKKWIKKRREAQEVKQ